MHASPEERAVFRTQELKAEVERLEAQIQTRTRLDEVVTQQRDALADAATALLAGRDGLEVVAFIPVVWNPGNPGSARQEVANTISAAQLRDALRKAGR